jgi:hypothetical protein
LNQTFILGKAKRCACYYGYATLDQGSARTIWAIGILIKSCPVTQGVSLGTRVISRDVDNAEWWLNLAQPAERQDDRERADAIWGGPDVMAMEGIVCLDLSRAMLIAVMVFATIYGPGCMKCV